MEIIFWTIATIVLLLMICSGLKRDDTDSPDKRSGMRLYTDHKTGLQYLGGMFGGITPRLNEDGTHMRIN